MPGWTSTIGLTGVFRARYISSIPKPRCTMSEYERRPQRSILYFQQCARFEVSALGSTT